jgi:hypothetical protein
MARSKQVLGAAEQAVHPAFSGLTQLKDRAAMDHQNFMKR